MQSTKEMKIQKKSWREHLEQNVTYERNYLEGECE